MRPREIRTDQGAGGGLVRRQLGDRCPYCLAVAHPYTWRNDGANVLALYRCLACGRHWQCWWNPACLEAGS